MDIEKIRSYALTLEDVTEGFPFGEETLVFKVKGKIFLLASLDSFPLQMNVKCNPDTAIQLRDEYVGCVLPGYHMNKKHWNTLILNGQIPNQKIIEWIDHSYELVNKKKKRK